MRFARHPAWVITSSTERQAQNLWSSARVEGVELSHQHAHTGPYPPAKYELLEQVSARHLPLRMTSLETCPLAVSFPSQPQQWTSKCGNLWIPKKDPRAMGTIYSSSFRGCGKGCSADWEWRTPFWSGCTGHVPTHHGGEAEGLPGGGCLCEHRALPGLVHICLLARRQPLCLCWHDAQAPAGSAAQPHQQLRYCPHQRVLLRPGRQSPRWGQLLPLSRPSPTEIPKAVISLCWWQFRRQSFKLYPFVTRNPVYWAEQLSAPCSWLGGAII